MKISIIGSGGWGCALAKVLWDNQHEVIVWSKFKNEIEDLKTYNEHKTRLAGIQLPKGIIYTSDLQMAVEESEMLIMAVPSIYVRSTAKEVSPFIKGKKIIVNVAKGIEDDTFYTLEEILKEELPTCYNAVLSGPSHAEEVARGIPTSVVVGSSDEEVAETIQNVFMNENFRVYASKDVVGIEIGGALKNVIALAAGISDGLGFGDNTKAALMTRGMSEIGRLGIAMGADVHTFNGLSGIGDLIVTCTSMHSRNRRAGILIGKGYSTQEAIDEVKMVVEGINSARAACGLAHKYNVELPIIEHVSKVLFEGANPKEAVADLMTREKKAEHNF